jgi:glycine dehydrogenase subunit 2
MDDLPADATRRVDLEVLRSKIGSDVAAIMLTNPNTCGLFERDIKNIADLIHEHGGYFYCDGANLNAIMGKCKVRDLGVDAMHINLHKTFSTPHGGGGPGAGPTVLSKRLAHFAPLPFVREDKNGQLELVELGEQQDQDHSFGRMCAFHGQMGMFVRALAYMISHGGDGLRQTSEDAVLNANYLLARLKGHLSPAFDDTCMHEALFDDHFLEGSGVSTLDFAKAMIDEGYHPMTMYFPLVVHGAMLIEPTESESLHSLDRFADTMIKLADAAKAGDTERFTQAPMGAALRRLDETRAARKPVLRWQQD